MAEHISLAASKPHYLVVVGHRPVSGDTILATDDATRAVDLARRFNECESREQFGVKASVLVELSPEV